MSKTIYKPSTYGLVSKFLLANTEATNKQISEYVCKEQGREFKQIGGTLIRGIRKKQNLKINNIHKKRGPYKKRKKSVNMPDIAPTRQIEMPIGRLEDSDLNINDLTTSKLCDLHDATRAELKRRLSI